MSNVKISIIVPMYKSEPFLIKCLDSISLQTLKEIEMILINDGSPDNSGKIADEYAKGDDRIKVVHQPNSGPGASRNRGIEVARGEYIGFVDSDDWVDPSMYEMLYEAARNNNAQVAMCNYIEEYMNPNRSLIISHPFKDQDLLDKEMISEHIITSFATNDNMGYYSLWNKVYKREWLLEQNLTINEERNHGEDWWFNLEIFSKATSVVFTTGEYYHYMHINTNSLMLKYNENQFELFLSGRKHLHHILRASGVDISKYKNELDRRFVDECIGCIYKEVLNQPKKNRATAYIDNILSNSEFNMAIQSYIPKSKMKKLLIILLKFRLLTCLRFIINTSWKTKNALIVLKNYTNY
ncbi:glycosyltransferase [Paenibacillus aceris]|uniref:Glycosyltransferase involved in cell wall biosynthesis n=1 Tax=Paenibacillus aceris TaxID=869555 RepID=A0ABS4I844_9BACL|nr:glycosyltransferase [Paenibacillus aceris]MBP1967063.1 glycosyltransferase involved in cell wall biosynthesis [Paenibacillus aceris]NHW33260.1 glycosyltransferase [Paenibacillus aceris]